MSTADASTADHAAPTVSGVGTGVGAAGAKPRVAWVGYIEYFRAIAIMLIVAQHALHPAMHVYPEVPATGDWVGNIFATSTAYFVFISGFLFYHIFYARFDYGKFMKGKFKNVFSPYMFYYAPIIVMAYITGSTVTQMLIEWNGDVYQSFYYHAVSFLATGTHTPYWYVPYIMLMFAASPVFLWFIRARSSIQIGITAVALVVGFLAHRPENAFGTFQQILYFLFFYLFGILCGMNQEKFVSFIRRPLVIVATGAIVFSLAYLQRHWLGTVGAVSAPVFAPADPDLSYIQKVAGCIFFCGVLHHLSRWNMPPLRVIAQYSFGVFFAHGLLIWASLWLPMEVRVLSGHYLLDVGAYWLIIMTLCMLGLFIGKRILGRHARYILGV